MTTKSTAIIGVGNYLMGDEGVGIHSINYLQQFDWPPEVELIDAGVPGPSLLFMIEDRKLSIIIDCADFNGKPGDIRVVNPDMLKKSEEEMISLHETNLLGTLALAEKADIHCGDIVIICVQPKHIKISGDMSDEVSHALPEIKKEILKLL